MTIGLSNSSKRARFYGSVVNQTSGGGNKKTGFPYQIGRGYRSSIALQCTDPINGHCCQLTELNRTNVVLANLSRNLGRNNNITYWKIPGVPGQ